MSPVLLLLAALIATALVVWAYGAREERVDGRRGPAVLRLLALFLMLAGLVLPALRGHVIGAPQVVVLLDLSASMSLPVRADDPAAITRLDSARLVVSRLAPDRLYRFGDASAGVPIESLDTLSAPDRRSRLAPALEAARLAGADSVYVVTDGDWTDRANALAAATDLGLGLREVRVAEAVSRAGIAAVRAPQRARAGDTVRIAVEVRATGAAGDSVTIGLELDGTTLASARIERPTAGRSTTAELAFVPLDPGEGASWRRYEAVLGEAADPLGVSDRYPVWMEISESATGAVVVSTAPDWEARFLVPALERLVLGGARGFMRLSDGRYLELSPTPRVVDESVVRRTIPGARLLVAHGAPDDLPDWLDDAVESQSRVFVLPRAAGDVPGAGVRLTGPVPGEWYAMGPIPPSPAAGFLVDVELDPLPPMTELYAVDAPDAWSVLTANRGRRGEPRPLLIAGERGLDRWAVAPGADWWRWAARGGASRRVYDGVLSGVVGWLVEDASPEVVSLIGTPAAGRPLEWRVRPGTTDLLIEVRDSGDRVVRVDSIPDPAERFLTDALPAGRHTLDVTAAGPDGAFAEERPLEIVPPPAELLPGAATEPAEIAAVLQDRPDIESRTPRPVWPFALAILLLCIEWMWRHRIGLR